MRTTCSYVAFLVFAHVAAFWTASPAHGTISGLQRVASGVSAPMFVTHAPGDRSRLFIAERGGGIRVLNLETGMLQASPFITIPNVSTDGEGGLLGLAFHPNYFNEGMDGFGKFYVNITTNATTVTHIREFEVMADNPNQADPASLREILSFSQPQTNHNGGWLGFSPNDHFLYIATGDGGGGDDNDTGHTAGTGNAQDITSNFLGKILRLDVDDDEFPADANRNYAIPPTNPFKAGVGDPGDDVGDDEIWAYGLRNPFRDSFDRITGDLWIGDVGQSAREEIDFQPADSAGGANYGWRLREGLIQTPSGGVGGAPPPGNVNPVYDYNRDNDAFGGTVVSGGYVYHGPDPSLQGLYFFLDSRNSAATGDDNYWFFNPTNPFGTVTNIDTRLTPDTGSPQWPVSFGEDAKGNLYIAYLVSGDVYRINTNELLPGDYDADGEVDDDDYLAWQAAFGTSGAGLPADGDGDGTVGAGDYVIWRKNLGASVHAGLGSGTAVVPEPATLIVASISVLLVLSTRRRTR